MVTDSQDDLKPPSILIFQMADTAMTQPLRIIQITDLHIGKEGEDTFGVDVRGNFLKVLLEVNMHRPDFLVISGDLCFDTGQVEIYHWIRSVLDRLPIPTYVIPGNHDDSELLAEAFDQRSMLREGELFYHLNRHDLTFLFLDTGRGFCSQNQLDWLLRQVVNASSGLVIFMHHPPALAGVPFMDTNYPFQQIEQIEALLASYKGGMLPIFCGHYHVEKTILQNDLAIHITPSTFFQIDQNSLSFKVDHKRIAYRLIEIGRHVLRSTVHYLD